jgi:predicted alpha/beta hydrolase family esterase
MRPVLLVPGIQNSGPAHWQSRWEALHPGVSRVQQRDWDHPVCDEWVATLDAAVRAQAQPPIVVAHSLGCLVVVRWAAAHPEVPVHAALLVAVPDPKGPAFPREALGFDPLPHALAGRRLKMVASHDDPYGSVAHARACARAWQAELLELTGFGHLNADSGLGDWPQAWAGVEAWRVEGRRAEG